jgi:hypothetical protein
MRSQISDVGAQINSLVYISSFDGVHDEGSPQAEPESKVQSKISSQQLEPIHQVLLSYRFFHFAFPKPPEHHAAFHRKLCEIHQGVGVE